VRGFSDGVYDNAWVSGVNIDDNRIPGATYVDLAGSYRFELTDAGRVEAYFKIDNLLDEDPEVVAGAGISALQTNPALYDVIGRAYRVGFRVRL
jgi:outer membrane receptor protein involved in Fe transport